MRRRCAALSALAALTALTACTSGGATTPTTSTTTPAPSPTFTCTSAPINGPCTAAKAQEEKQQAAAVAASTAAYKSFLAEYVRVARAGGSTQATVGMRKYAAGPYLEGYTGFASDLAKQKLHDSGDVKILAFQFQPGVHRTSSPDSELTFRFCQDARENRVLDSQGKTVARGLLLTGEIYTRLIDGTWKLWDEDDQEATKCDIA